MRENGETHRTYKMEKTEGTEVAMRTKSKERTEKMKGSLKIANETKKIKTNNGELHNTKRKQMKHGRWREWRKQRQNRGKPPEKKNTDYKEQGEIKIKANGGNKQKK